MAAFPKILPYCAVEVGHSVGWWVH